ncbi:hypothetical protein M758_9G178700 [Ceratodon purpureus]|nr:hypothetical protein M758_9G178700 [Ceratodon purpureus]
MPPRRKRGHGTEADAAKLVKRKRDPDANVLDSPSRSPSSQVKHVALLRGINVGTAKQVPMAKLTLCFEQLGYHNVKTVLRSGNVVFEGNATLAPDAAACVEAAVKKATGVQSSVLLINGARFTAIADANPLLDVATDGSKSFVSFVDGDIPRDLEVPDPSDLAPEVLHVVADAIYQWMPAGFLKTAVPKSFWKQFDSPVTARNWNTVNKILALLQ